MKNNALLKTCSLHSTILKALKGHTFMHWKNIQHILKWNLKEAEIKEFEGIK